jgi:hypothetical protein
MCRLFINASQECCVGLLNVLLLKIENGKSDNAENKNLPHSKL